MRSVRRGVAGRRFGVAVLVAALLAVTACSGTSGSATDPKAQSSPVESVSPTPEATIALTVSPADNAARVVTGTDVKLVTDGKVDQVKLTAADGKPVSGRLSEDGLTWTPGTQLAFSTKYSLEVTASKNGATKTATSTFTTMGRPGTTTGADIYVYDGETVGVGLPIVVEFTRKVATNRRAAIERRLFVDSTPAVVGSWHWWSDSEVHYRPKDHWPSGTKVAVRLAVGGMDMGFGRYGKRDRVVKFTVGSAVTSRISNSAKRMYVYRGGVLLRSFPISLGKPKFPTPSGTLVVMERKETAIFDSSSYGLPVDSPDGYRTKVNWNTRVTWGGIFVHAAPWSVGDQGRRNVSHGCVNAATSNAKWFFDLSKRGDVVKIEGTEVRAAKGEGWTDWSLSWDQYLAGSALR